MIARGWMPRNTARHASRSIHCLKLEAPSGTAVCTVFISHQMIVLWFWQSTLTPEFFASLSSSLVPSDSPDRSFSIGSRSRGSKSCFFRAATGLTGVLQAAQQLLQQTSVFLSALLLQREPSRHASMGDLELLLTKKSLISWLVPPIKSACNLIQLQETFAGIPSHLHNTYQVLFVYSMQFCLFHSNILRVPKDFPQPHQARKKHVNKQPDGDKRLIHTTPSHFNFLFRIT